MQNKNLHHLLKERLLQELPGYAAHKIVAPYRYSPEKYGDRLSSAKLSSTLILLYLKEGIWHTVFMERTVYEGAHSGQISFPGGKTEETDYDYIHTALRESNEELGIESDKVTIIGKLSELFVPISDFLIYPVVGIYDGVPQFIKDEIEVQSIIEVSLDYLFNASNFKSKKLKHSNQLLVETPYFDVYGHTIWGATAMMVNELKVILKEISD